MTGRQIVFENKKEPIVDYRANLDFALQAQRIKLASQADQREATVTLRAEKPALFLFVSDPHLFSLYCNYEAFKKHMELVEKQHIYVITVGDLGEFYNVSLGRVSSGTFEQVFDPELQALSIRQWLTELDQKGLLLAVADGNHEGFLNTAGIGYSSTYLRGLQCPLMSPGGYLTINLGKETYKIVLSHRWRGNSRLHPANAAKTLMQDVWPEADVAVVGHTHKKAIEMMEVAGSPKVWIIAGTYKDRDPWCLSRGFGDPVLGGACVLLDPKKHTVIPFWNIEEAVALLRA